MQTAAVALEVPLVVIRLNPRFMREVQRTLAGQERVVVCADSLYAGSTPSGSRRSRETSIRSGCARCWLPTATRFARLDPSRPVLVTEAARRQLADLPLPRSFPDQPAIDPESADELPELLIRLSLEETRGPRSG